MNRNRDAFCEKFYHGNIKKLLVKTIAKDKAKKKINFGRMFKYFKKYRLDSSLEIILKRMPDDCGWEEHRVIGRVLTLTDKNTKIVVTENFD